MKKWSRRVTCKLNRIREQDLTIYNATFLEEKHNPFKKAIYKGFLKKS